MKTTIYIKKQDEQRWKDIPNKSQWIADMLNDHDTDLDKRIKQIAKQAFQELMDAHMN